MHIEIIIAPYEYTPGKYVAYREMCVYNGRSFANYVTAKSNRSYSDPGFKFSVILN